MFTVTVWDVRAQRYVVKFDGSRADCDGWVNTRRAIGDRATYLIRRR